MAGRYVKRIGSGTGGPYTRGPADCAGLVRGTLVIPQNASDRDGNWDVGAMAVLIDDVAACAVASYSEQLFVKASLDIHISFYSTPKTREEVEVEAKISRREGKANISGGGGEAEREWRDDCCWQGMVLDRSHQPIPPAHHHQQALNT